MIKKNESTQKVKSFQMITNIANKYVSPNDLNIIEYNLNKYIYRGEWNRIKTTKYKNIKKRTEY